MVGKMMKNFAPELRRLLKPGVPQRRCDWAAVEATLGLALPVDFKEFWDVFPSGCLGFRERDPTLLVLHGPFGPSAYLRFPDCVRVMADSYRRLRAQFPALHPHRMWPEQGGLIGFAHDSNGTDYYLRPDDGKVQAWGDGEATLHPYTFSEFLWEVAHNRVLIAEAFQGPANDSSLTVWSETK
jgi:hypothetical protein